ncbi:MAG TPA: GNAT family N-acetyltransferase [Pilimelia sp.]|nr:GNAT family N-acetyltransferase [Pilimelia sp.]
MEPVEIAVGDLLLRGWRPGDAESVHAACQDPAIQRWTTVPSPYTRAHADEFVGRLAPAALADGSAVHLAVCDAAGGALLGACGLVGIDRPGRTAELGYWTVPAARGRGVALRAARALAGWAFTVLDLDHLRWRAEVGNHASRQVALRLGVRVDGVVRDGARRADGGYVPAWVGSLRRHELAAGGDDLPAGPGSLAARQAAVFAGDCPRLSARAPGGPVWLRPPGEADLDAIVAACQDPEAHRWIPLPRPYQRHHAQLWVQEHAPQRWARGEGVTYVLADAADRYVGGMELRLHGTDPARADVGFLAAPAARGRGYVPAALDALCRWAFAALGVVRVEWRAYLGNDASRRAAEKAGFTLEGTCRARLVYRDERRDCLLGARLATDPIPAAPATGPAT